MPAVKGRKKLLAEPGSEIESFLLSSRLLVFERAHQADNSSESRLEEEANKEKRTELLRTHPGVGPITSLALVHTLGDVRRFRRETL